MKTLLEMNLGYVTCDIDGEGYNSIAVWQDESMPEDKQFRFIRNSRCYGNLDIQDISKDELIEHVKAARFFIGSRRARKQFNEFLRDLKRGNFDKVDNTATVPTNEVWGRMPEPTYVDVADAWEPVEYFDVDDQLTDDDSCNCPGCRQARMQEQSLVRTMQYPTYNDLTVIEPNRSGSDPFWSWVNNVALPNETGNYPA